MNHIVQKSTYYTVFAWLTGLLVLTVVVSQIDLGAANVPIALTIAIVKAILIVLFFMHARYGSPLLRLFAAGGFFWLLIMLAFIMADVRARSVGW
jgi:cytochrome c oxidase subunit 4